MCSSSLSLLDEDDEEHVVVVVAAAAEVVVMEVEEVTEVLLNDELAALMGFGTETRTTSELTPKISSSEDSCLRSSGSESLRRFAGGSRLSKQVSSASGLHALRTS